MSEENTDRMQQIQLELQSILDSRLDALAKALRTTETTTRKIVAAELDIERHQATQQRLLAEFDGLDVEVQKAKEAANAVEQEFRSKVEERDQLASDIQRIEGELKDVVLSTDRTRTQVADLEKESETLRDENTALKTKLKTLEENITRMRRLKEEMRSSLSGLTAQMTGLAGGNK